MYVALCRYIISQMLNLELEIIIRHHYLQQVRSSELIFVKQYRKKITPISLPIGVIVTYQLVVIPDLCVQHYRHDKHQNILVFFFFGGSDQSCTFGRGQVKDDFIGVQGIEHFNDEA